MCGLICCGSLCVHNYCKFLYVCIITVCVRVCVDFTVRVEILLCFCGCWLYTFVCLFVGFSKCAWDRCASLYVRWIAVCNHVRDDSLCVSMCTLNLRFSVCVGSMSISMRVRLQGIFKRVEFLFVLYACVLNYRVVLLSVGILCVFMRIYIYVFICAEEILLCLAIFMFVSTSLELHLARCCIY